MHKALHVAFEDDCRPAELIYQCLHNHDNSAYRPRPHNSRHASTQKLFSSNLGLCVALESTMAMRGTSLGIARRLPNWHTSLA